jgi:hypothetical protein
VLLFLPQQVDIILESEIETPPAIIDFNTQKHHFIVVIDNEKNIHEGLCTLMNLWGYDVLTASSYAQALKQIEIQKRTPNAIISDFRLETTPPGSKPYRVYTTLSLRYSCTHYHRRHRGGSPHRNKCQQLSGFI